MKMDANNFLWHTYSGIWTGLQKYFQNWFILLCFEGKQIVNNVLSLHIFEIAYNKESTQ